MLRGGFFLDALEDLGLVLRPVVIHGLVVFGPQFGQGVPAVVLGAGGEGKIHQSQKC